MDKSDITEELILGIIEDLWAKRDKVTASSVVNEIITPPSFDEFPSPKSYIDAWDEYSRLSGKVRRVLYKLLKEGTLSKIPGYYYTRYAPQNVEPDKFSGQAEKGLRIKGDRIRRKFKGLGVTLENTSLPHLDSLPALLGYYSDSSNFPGEITKDSERDFKSGYGQSHWREMEIEDEQDKR